MTDPNDFLGRIHDPLVKDLLINADAQSRLCGDNYIQRAGVWAECARMLAVLADERRPGEGTGNPPEILIRDPRFPH